MPGSRPEPREKRTPLVAAGSFHRRTPLRRRSTRAAYMRVLTLRLDWRIFSSFRSLAMHAEAVQSRRSRAKRRRDVIAVPLLLWAFAGTGFCFCPHSHESEPDAEAIADSSHHEAGARAHSSESAHRHHGDQGDGHSRDHHESEGSDGECGGRDCGPSHECDCGDAQIAAVKSFALDPLVDFSIPVSHGGVGFARRALRKSAYPLPVPVVRAIGPPAFLEYCAFRC